MTTTLKVGFSDKWLLALHRQAVEKIGEERLGSYDRAYPTIDYEKTSKGKGTPGPDGTLQSYELIQAFIQEPELQDLYRKADGKPLPWQPSDNKLNREIFARFDGMIAAWRKENPEKDRLGKELAQEIFQWIARPKEKGGLGMGQIYGHPESTFDEAVATTYADCNETYYALEVFYKRAGYSIEPEFVRVDPNGNAILHVAGKLQIGQNFFLVDPLYHSFDAQHREHTPMTHQQLLGFSLLNRAALEVKRNRFSNRSDELLQRAQWVDPHNPFVYLSRAWDLAGRKPPQFDKSQRELEQANQIAPNFSETYGYWGFFYDRQGNFKKAIEYYRKALDAEPREQKTRVYLVQALGCDGQETAAKAELQVLYDSYGEQWSWEEQQQYQRLTNWLSNQLQNNSCGKK